MAERPAEEMSKRELMLGFRALARIVREELRISKSPERRSTLAEIAAFWSEETTPEEIYALERIEHTGS
jgi:hypothetical protein